jgi:CHAT domain-containing protein
LQYFEGLEKDDYKTIVNAYESAKESVKLLEDNSLRNLQGREENNESVKLDSYRILIDIANYLFTKTSDKNYFETIYDASEQSRARSFVKEVGTQLIAKLNNPQAKQIATLAKLSKTGSEDFTMISNEQPVSRSVTRSGLKVVRDTSDKTIDTQNRYDALLKEIKGQNTKIANLVSANIPSVEGLSSLLQDNDALVDYYCSYSKTYLLFITKNAWKLIDLKTSPAEIQSIVEDYHRCLQNYTTREFEEVSSRLYTILLAPVNSEIKGKRLYIVPSGKLHNIPFGSLLTDGKFLAEINQICLLPNASAMQFVIRKDNNKKKPEWSMLAIGNPVNPEAVELLGAENEVNVINDIFPNTQVLLKYDATESAVKKYINNFDIVHFACHGIFNYEYPLLSALVLAPGDSDDGRLELHEIYNLDLVRTKLVVLSACQTGLAQIKKNDDMTGLVRGFLYAGVPSVIASLWQVDDQSTFILMTRFYYYLNQGFSKAESLQKAQIELIKSQDYSHPYFWSAFCLNGYGD